MRTIEKIIGVILIIIFITFLINHGHISFDGVDWVFGKTKEAVTSEQGQETVTELKDIAVDVTDQFVDETKKLISKEKEQKDQKRYAAELLRVIDGDTLLVKYNKEDVRVRLIGIDTPESVNPDETKNNDYGIIASDHTKDLLENIETVYLEFDEETEDTYGRTLAYVWLTEENTIPTTATIKEEMLNGIILSDGYAINVEFKPNIRYSTYFSIICKEAVKEERGLWKYEEFSNLWQ